jgi:hypothetical protein
LVEETGGPGENHRPVASHWQTLSHLDNALIAPSNKQTNKLYRYILIIVYYTYTEFSTNLTVRCWFFLQLRKVSWVRCFFFILQTGGPAENHRPVASHWQTLSHLDNALIEIRTHTSGDRFVLIWTI